MTAPGTDTTRRLRPELRPLATFRTDLSSDGLAALRDALNARRRNSVAACDSPGVDIVDERVRGNGAHDIPIRIYRGGCAGAPAVVFLHSGAFVLGNLDTDHRQCVELARRASCTVVSTDYRLAPEHPYPAGLDDAHAVLEWLATQSEALEVDAHRLAVAGSSAGGALAAVLAQHSAAGLAPSIVFQLLHQPVLDDAPTPSKLEFTSTPGFDGPATEAMWHHLCGGGPVPSGAVPARADELSAVAPALITCSELDPLRDEAVDYARRLLSVGVSTELHVFPGTCHGFDSLLPDWVVSQRLYALQGNALRRALHGRD